jgi:hypothetical protein
MCLTIDYNIPRERLEINFSRNMRSFIIYNIFINKC